MGERDPLTEQPERPATDARGVEFRVVEWRATGDGEPAGFDGYPSTFWQVDQHGTAFAPGAWTKTIKDQKGTVPVLWSHNMWFDHVPIGHSTKLEQDETGLRAVAVVNEELPLGAEVMSALRFGTPLGLSVGFRRIRERPPDEKDPLVFDGATEWVRKNPDMVSVITEARLFEFSPVVFGSNPKALPTAIRAAGADLLASLLSDLRAGRLDPAYRPVLADLVAAWTSAPAPEPPAAPAPRARRIDLEATLARWGALARVGAGA